MGKQHSELAPWSSICKRGSIHVGFVMFTWGPARGRPPSGLGGHSTAIAHSKRSKATRITVATILCQMSVPGHSSAQVGSGIRNSLSIVERSHRRSSTSWKGPRRRGPVVEATSLLGSGDPKFITSMRMKIPQRWWTTIKSFTPIVMRIIVRPPTHWFVLFSRPQVRKFSLHLKDSKKSLFSLPLNLK